MKTSFQIPAIFKLVMITGIFTFITGICNAQFSKESSLTIDNGLVNNEVTAIHQDKYGFIWFGTRGGLDRFDGYDFNNLRYKNKFSINLTSQAVEAIAEDNRHTLWIGTKNGGLNSYDLSKDSISHYFPDERIKIQEIKDLAVDRVGKLYIASLHGLYTFKNGKFGTIDNKLTVNCINIDKYGNVWVGTTFGLFVLEKNSDHLKKVTFGKRRPAINSIAISKDGQTLYLGTWFTGLLVYHVKENKIEQFLDAEKSKISLNGNNNIYRVYLDKSQNLWVGTWGAGLKKFDLKTNKFERIEISSNNVFNKDYDIILSIHQDVTGIIWIGTDGGGVCKIDPYKKAFKTIAYEAAQKAGLSNTHIKSVFVDTDGGLWLGTKGDGLFYSKDKKSFFKKETGNKVRVVNAFFENDKKDLWVGTDKGLLIYKNYKQEKPAKPIYVDNWQDSLGLSGPKITSIVKDKNQVIWLGTQEHGLNKLARSNNDLYYFKKYSEKVGVKGALQSTRISCMLIDNKDRLWIGTYDGLHIYEPGSDDFYVIKRKQDSENTISNNTILSLAQDQKGNIWIGTQQGLNQLEFKSKTDYKFTNFFEQAGLPNDYIHAILVDQFNNIWMSTNSGISKYNTSKNIFINFDERDGVATNTFSENSSFKSFNGQMFFGGISGLTYFYPDNIRLNRYQPKIFITNLKINNVDVQVGKTDEKSVILKKALFLTKRIELNYKENIVTLSFSALDFHASNKNQYRYKLEGFEKSWVNSGKRRTVTYTNLPAGNYTFRVQASNSDQVWSEDEAKLNIQILPPPWETWWAYTVYCFIILGLLGFSRYITLSRLRLKNKLHIADLNFKKEHEITEIKGKFFSNISHEFRTPLTLMIGPLESLSYNDSMDTAAKSILEKVQNQSKRLLSLVNQLLDFNKAENNTLNLNAFDQEVVGLLSGIYNSFLEEANRKNINYRFEASEDTIYLTVDKEKLESICYNLLSNAFKFTQRGGEISFKIKTFNAESNCEIVVSDNGKGVSEKDKAKIFDRFYQVSQAEAGQYAGTGIGLAFVKDLVLLHKGSISIEDNLPKGSIFKVILPYKQSTSSADKAAQKTQKTSLTKNQDASPTENIALTEKPIILVVEDNEELNHYICETLASTGEVFSSINGKDGIEKAFEIMPDLVVSDVMMPGIDGYALCKILKSDSRTSHIPIVLLTAKSDDTSLVQGLEFGADNYLTKPFNPSVLISYINNIIKSRLKLRELFANRLTLSPTDVEVDSFDEEFIKKSIQFIEENMRNEKPSIDELAKQLNMSRSTFYRKLKAVTGMSGTDFISLIRLKRSAQLLETGEYSVSMAAYEVGYNDLKNFRKSFHNQFGKNPSDYLKAYLK
ncbi:hybrid sensor histidine kinase/response regulator [Pedobacter segetis]|uniref:hybrid sensor histidine kinase/response regulator n=1 Tax=Pedobacter segetis TaxID=2793069 RepID=UPI00190AFAE2|nr:hybrid sensor histidine kinase/response regulator transcription factor [Pedobacter segetis]